MMPKTPKQLMKEAARKLMVRARVDIPRPNLGIDPFEVLAPVALMTFPRANMSAKSKVDLSKGEITENAPGLSSVKMTLGNGVM